jgi:hypothetical protein
MVNLSTRWQDDLSADLLVLAGVATLAEVLVGSLVGRLYLSRGSRLMLTLIGLMFAALGFLVHSNHNLSASARSSTVLDSNNSATTPFDPDTSNFSAAALDKYLGKLGSPPEYFGQGHVSAASFLGTWVSLDGAKPIDIKQLRIVADGKRLLVRAWGRCALTDCNWGQQEAVLNQNRVNVSYRMSGVIHQVRLVLTTSGELQAEILQKSPGRPDQLTESLFGRLN